MGWVINITARPLYPRERSGTHFIWPQGRFGRLRKTSPQPGFDPRTVQSVTSHYTDWAILSLCVFCVFKKFCTLFTINSSAFGSVVQIFFIVGTSQFREINRRFKLKMDCCNGDDLTRSCWSRTWYLELHFPNRIPHTVTTKTRIDCTRIIPHRL